MSAVKKQRNANMDLLRIVSMLLIVFLHTIDHSGVLENAENCGTGMYFYIRFAYMLCQVCVNLYVMLSGYFMITSKFRLHKLVTLWMETAFYAFGLKLLFMILGKEAFSVASLVSCLVPLFTGRYWFLTIYVGMYLISPFLNLLIRAMTKQQHTLLTIVLFFILSLWSSVHPAFAGMNAGGGWGLAWFVVLYITAAWFRLHYTPNRKHIGLMAVFFVIPLLIAAIQCLPVGGIVQNIVGNWFGYDSAPAYIMTLCLFVGFLNFNIRSQKLSRVICAVAPLTLGVYLIHAHANVDPWIWSVLQLPSKMSSALFPLIQIGCVLGIFLICIGIDALRKVTVGRLENSKLIVTASEKLWAAVTRLYNHLITRS